MDIASWSLRSTASSATPYCSAIRHTGEITVDDVLQALYVEEETELQDKLCQYCLDMADMGYGLTIEDIKVIAYRVSAGSVSSRGTHEVHITCVVVHTEVCPCFSELITVPIFLRAYNWQVRTHSCMFDAIKTGCYSSVHVDGIHTC